MKKSSQEMFKANLDKAYSDPGVSLNQSTMLDNAQYKGSFKEEKLEGGLADGMSLGDIAAKHKVDIDELTKQFLMGVKVEKEEHSKNEKEATEIALDHLYEDPKYYTKLKKIENKEATGSGSSGAYSGPLFGDNTNFIKKSQSETPKISEGMIGGDIEKVEATEATGSGSSGAYETPAAWAKSTKKKDWGGRKKTQYPGGTFVSIKKKCQKFPYCNQGDIKALNLYKNESVSKAIKNVSQRMNISENVIKSILQYEFEKLNKRIK